MLFSDDDRRRIAQAITAAERTTSGEIVAVVVGSSASYVSVAPLAAGLVALLVPLPLIFFTWLPVQTIYLLQLAVFVAVLLLVYWKPIRYALVPASIKRQRAHRRAMEQFVAQNLYTTAGHTGVLIFLSEAERYAEIIADQGVHKKVPAGAWQGLVDDLTRRIGQGEAADGLIATIAGLGRLLAEHYPPGTSDPDEIPNHLIVLE